jgi:hypothetical protein
MTRGSTERARVKGIVSPVGAVTRGVVAGTVGTLAMDLWLYGWYRRGDGKSGFARWEFSADVLSWDQAPAPAQVGKRLFEGLFRRELPDHRAALVNNVTHWGFGIVNGVPYGILVGSLPRPRIRYGIPFAVSVWSGGYVVLPAAGLYERIWEYPRQVLARDLAAHLVYGLTTAAVFRALWPSRRARR